MDSVLINNFKETIQVKLEELKESQGNLKSLNKKEYAKFKSQLLSNGFTAPFIIWIDKDKTKWILDGHTRKHTIQKMQSEGIIVPKLFPASVIEAKDRKAAMKVLLGLVSQYGKASNETLSDFLIAEEINFEWLSENVDIPHIDFKIEEPEQTEKKSKECPHCGEVL